ncbi:MAG TPA: PKD domain-containing protein, partial [Bacteroidia bacterium]|nr:PKD domain-containing protein [Bacteroidia bacterium]
MRKQHYKFTIGIFILISLCCFQLKAQKQPTFINSSPIAYTEEFLFDAKKLADWKIIQSEFSKQMQIDANATAYFFKYLRRQKNPSYLQYGRNYIQNVKSGSITKSNATQYWLDLIPAFVEIYKAELEKISNSLKPEPRVAAAPTASCNNLDFTDPNNPTTGWTGRWNNNINSSAYNTAPTALPTVGLNSSGTNNMDYVHEIVTTGNDPNVGISRVPPGHSVALRLGDDEAFNLDVGDQLPFNHQMIRNTFTVSATNPTITYWYAVVFSQEKSGAHGSGDQPFFKIRMFDKNGNEIKCASYDVDVSTGLSGGFLKKDLPYTFGNGTQEEGVYKDWQPIFIPLINYVGQQVTIQFESSDCAAGGHYGYAYVAVDCGPYEAITSTPFICGSSTIQLTAPQGSSTYKWTGPGVIQPDNVRTISANAPGKYTVTMSVVGNSGVTCTYTLDTVIAGTANLPIANFTSNVVCVGNSTKFTDSSTPNGSITEWAWDFNGDGIIDSKLQNPTYTFSTAGTHDVQLIVKQGPCEAQVTLKVTVDPLPVLKITNPPAVCLPTKVNITAANVTTGSTGGGTLTYWTDAAGTIPLSNPGTISSSGTYYIKTTTSGGCTDIKPVVVTINPGASLNITDPPAVCIPGTVDITAAYITAGSINTGTLTYWSDPAGTVSVSNPSAIGTSGTYYIKATPASGCTDIQPVKVTISPLPTLNITTPAPVCMPGTVDLTAPAVTIGSTPGGTYTYWKDNAATIILPNPNAVNASGTYYIKIVVAGGCAVVQPVSVVINPLPVSNAGPDVLICTGENATLGTTATVNYSYSWSPATGLNSTTISNPIVTLTNTGKVPVSSQYVVTTTNTLTNCVTTDTVKVTVNSVPTVNAGSAASVCPGTSVKLKGSIGGSATSAAWSGGKGVF